MARVSLLILYVYASYLLSFYVGAQYPPMYDMQGFQEMQTMPQMFSYPTQLEATDYYEPAPPPFKNHHHHHHTKNKSNRRKNKSQRMKVRADHDVSHSQESDEKFNHKESHSKESKSSEECTMNSCQQCTANSSPCESFCEVCFKNQLPVNQEILFVPYPYPFLVNMQSSDQNPHTTETKDQISHETDRTTADSTTEPITTKVTKPTKTTDQSIKTTSTTKTTDQSIKTTDQSTKTTDQSAKTTDQSTKTTDQSTKTTDQSTKTTDQSTKTTSTTTQKPKKKKARRRTNYDEVIENINVNDIETTTLPNDSLYDSINQNKFTLRTYDEMYIPVNDNKPIPRKSNGFTHVDESAAARDVSGKLDSKFNLAENVSPPLQYSDNDLPFSLVNHVMTANGKSKHILISPRAGKKHNPIEIILETSKKHTKSKNVNDVIFKLPEHDTNYVITALRRLNAGTYNRIPITDNLASDIMLQLRATKPIVKDTTAVRGRKRVLPGKLTDAEDMLNRANDLTIDLVNKIYKN